MADVFLDCEWILGDYFTILGAYSYGQDRFQLYDETLTRNRLSRFLNICSEHGRKEIFLFCHGPDIGRIERFLDLDLRNYYHCINTVTAFQTYTYFKDRTLGHLEQYFGLPRKYAFTTDEIRKLWNSEREKERRRVLAYNWEDCKNLWRLVRKLIKEYGVTRGDLKAIAME